RRGAVLAPDPAVHPADELAADVEAEPGSADAAVEVGVEAIELLEDAVAVADRDAQALVLDDEAGDALAGLDPDADGPACGRVLHRVVDEVRQHLAHLVRVGGDAREAVRGVELD